ncbi:MAG: exonuclease SbcCD subunit D C-terminal domain-containing protein [Solirubrobacterales bacterium]|nr:exonuclease SbcCD subunit D C-terminal domain-containing protein [Solirubrobacterales bacterium]
MIRILHTADWHLGREFHGRDLTEPHLAFFEWLAEQVEAREVDLVLMAGDIYDRALPPVGAIDLFNRQVARLTDLAEVVLITGNHDSVVRMSHGPLLRPNLHLRSGLEGLGSPVMVERDFPLAVYPIPYLDPVTMASELDLDASTHTAVLGEAVRRCHEDLEARGGGRSIAIAHAFVAGAVESESERSIQVGGSENVTADLFDGFDYVALGHLHRPQSVGPNLRYAGSPIPLSYSEVGVGAPKSVTLLELTAEGELTQTPIEIPQPVTMERLRGTLDELLTDPRFDPSRENWLEVTLTDETRPDQPMERLRSRFENVVNLRFEAPLAGVDPEEAVKLAEIAEADPAALVASFVEEVKGVPPNEAEHALIREALDHRAGEETVS